MTRFSVHRLTWLNMISALVLCAAIQAHAGVVDFEDLTPSTSYSGGGKFWNGSDGAGQFVSNGVVFANSYDKTYRSWTGWSYSDTSDTGTAGYMNQYSAFTGEDHTPEPGKNYGVYCQPWSLSPTVTLAPNTIVQGAWITNTTYAALSMFQGDQFAKKFGGDDGNDADWFLLSISGKNSAGESHTVDFYLADYRFADNTLDYVVDAWKWVDLTALGDAQELTFGLSSSDLNEWGMMNTPAYFAIDDLVFSEAPEPSTCALLATGALCGAALVWRRNRRRGESR